MVDSYDPPPPQVSLRFLKNAFDRGQMQALRYRLCGHSQALADECLSTDIIVCFIRCHNNSIIQGITVIQVTFLLV